MKRQMITLMVVFIGWTSMGELQAFPPAPHHLFMGMVRDEYGNPLHDSDATVLFVTGNGSVLIAPVRLDLTPGINFRLEVPMDAGLVGEPYMNTAMQRAMPFEIWIEVGGILYSPLEVFGDFSLMGDPGKTTTMDLTLGVDRDGDGIPDAWEEALLAALNGDGQVQDIDPNGDLDGDGLSNLDEYYTGNYAFDKNDGLVLSIAGSSNGRPLVEWLAIRGRSYSLSASIDMETWVPVDFWIEGESESVPLSQFHSDDVQQVRASIRLEEEQLEFAFFRLVMQ